MSTTVKELQTAQRISNCPACNAQKAGVKSRRAIPHTCGLDRMPKAFGGFDLKRFLRQQ